LHYRHQAVSGKVRAAQRDLRPRDERLVERQSEIEMQQTCGANMVCRRFVFFVFVLLELSVAAPHFNQVTTSNAGDISPTGMVEIKNSISNWYSHKFLFTCDDCTVLNKHAAGVDFKEVHMRIHDVGVVRQIGLHGDAIECSRSSRMLLVISRTSGIRPDSSVPERIKAQAEQVWANVCAAPARANNALLNLVKICRVKIRRYVVSASDMPAYVEARTCALGHSRTTSTSLVLPAFVRSPCPVGVKAIAVDAPLG
jgi:enamine deaminase RidA (YjgF/YER057c/UK114 family)